MHFKALRNFFKAKFFFCVCCFVLFLCFSIHINVLHSGNKGRRWQRHVSAELLNVFSLMIIEYFIFQERLRSYLLCVCFLFTLISLFSCGYSFLFFFPFFCLCLLSDSLQMFVISTLQKQLFLKDKNKNKKKQISD